MVRHPPLLVIAAQLEGLAAVLRDDRAVQAQRWAAILAARGYPTSTLGDGVRGSDTTTATERAVGLAGHTGGLSPPDAEWLNVDADLARLLRLVWATTLRIETTIDRVLAHAPDDDPIPAGTGPCALRTCEHFCDPRKKPSDRLRRRLCPYHYGRWLELGRPDPTTLNRLLQQAA